MPVTDTTDIQAQEQALTDKRANLNEFIERASRQRERDAFLSQWHMDAYSAFNVTLPYNHNSTYINVTVINYDSNLKSYLIDTIQTLEELSNIAKFCQYMHRKHPEITWTKEYDKDDFEITVNVPATDTRPAITINYFSKREAVCTKKVVGTKIVPAYTTPERIEEIVEWDCAPISLLK